MAGVSTSTVSLVINGKAAGRVSQETQDRVHAAVQHLGYRIDGVARSLATGRRNSVALTVPDLVNPYFSQVTMGVAEGLGDYQLMLLVTRVDDDRFTVNVENMLAERVDGVLAEAPGARLVEELDVPCPVVVLDRPTQGTTLPHVDFDLAKGVRELAAHLVELGHRHLGYVDAARQGPTFQTRRQLLLRRMRGLTEDPVTLSTTRSATTVEEAAAEFRQRWPQWRADGVSCVVCATDIQAYGVVDAAQELGIAVPGELSVAAFDDLPFSKILAPGGLTTITLSGYELGLRSAALLRELMDGRRPEETHVRLSCELQVRGTTGPKKGRRAKRA
ncbi:MAG: LacI family DNA-binding transcriptional regulator [Streptosporangiales bacterium]|nr:LacI family DNA-binding transcriptional regulator [Streptosporangiales bacterium]